MLLAFLEALGTAALKGLGGALAAAPAPLASCCNAGAAPLTDGAFSWFKTVETPARTQVREDVGEAIELLVHHV